jgi:hypothetical protein
MPKRKDGIGRTYSMYGELRSLKIIWLENLVRRDHLTGWMTR